MNNWKSAGTIEQKGVAQLLQIEEVQLNFVECVVFSSLLHSLRHILLGFICCIQTYFYILKKFQDNSFICRGAPHGKINKSE